MIRKFFAVPALAALTLGSLAIFGAGSAQAAAPVTFKGSISCSLEGTVTFTPALSNSQTTAATSATFKGTNSDCKGVKGTSLTQGGETLTGSTDTLTFTLPASTSGSCASLAAGTVPAAAAVVKWTGTSPIKLSKLTLPAGTINLTTGVIEYLKGKSAGSFRGTAQLALEAADISEPNGTSLPYSASNAATACAGPGISDIEFVQPNPEPKPFSEDDNLEVGKAY